MTTLLKWSSRKSALLVLFTICMIVFTACGNGREKTNSAEKTKKDYDYELAGGDGLHLVMIVKENLNGFTEKIGVVDDDGNWVQEPSPAHPFFRHKLLPDPGSVGVSVVTMSGKPIKADSKIKENARVAEAKEKLEYLGEGICGFRYHTGMNSYLFYDMATGECFDAGTCTRLTQFHDGYLVCAGDSHVISPVKIVSHDGEVIYPDIMTGSEDLGTYSEGKYFNGTNFYDLEGTKVIELEQYKIVNSPAFRGGRCELEIENDLGSRYSVEIDEAGEFLSEPVKLQ